MGVQSASMSPAEPSLKSSRSSAESQLRLSSSSAAECSSGASPKSAAKPAPTASATSLKPKVQQPTTHAKMAPPAKAEPAANFAVGKFAAPAAPSAPKGAMTMDEIEALARKETEEMAARMKAAGMTPRGPQIMGGGGEALNFDDVVNGRAKPSRAPLDLDNLPQEPNDGLFGPGDERLNPAPAAAPAPLDFGSRLGAAIDDVTVNSNPTVKDVERKWYLIKSKKGCIVRAGVELDTDHVTNLDHQAEILVDGAGQTKEGKERYRIIDPVKGWTSAAVCKARPGFKNTQTFQEFMDAQAKRGQPKLW